MTSVVNAGGTAEQAPTRITVGGDAPYDVVVGTNVLAEVGPMLGADAMRVAIIHPPTLAGLAEGLRRQLAESGRQVEVLAIPDGEAAARVGLNRDRPLLVGNVRGRMKTMLDERRPLYDEVAVLTVSTDDRSVDEVVELVLAGLAARAGESA